MARKGSSSTSYAQSIENSPSSGRPTLSRKRTRSTAELDSASESADEAGDHEGGDDRRRLPGVKRACNECRQQKLRCDVVQEPFSQCSRCRRLKLECKIESTFKRVGKRSRNAEMERELMELRRQLESSSAQHSPSSSRPTLVAASSAIVESPGNMQATVQHDYMGPDEVIASLLDLRQGLDGGSSYLRNVNGSAPGTRRLDNLAVSGDRIVELFNHFFTYYHPFLPLLDRSRSPDYYYEKSPLLFWTVISIASRRFETDLSLRKALAPAVSQLVWSTLGDIPQTYYVVKALCLLCTWPFPVSTTSADATFMLCGVMMQVAMQIGLHRPSHAQDFARFRVELRDEDLRDRVKTWATCNIVAQCVGTGYGQRPWTLYDWTLEPSSRESSYRLPDDLSTRIQVEKFCDKVTKSLYSNPRDAVGLARGEERYTLCSVLARDFEELEAQIGANVSEAIDALHLRAAELHLRLSAFFESSTTKSSYSQELSKLYLAAKSFLIHVLSLDEPNGGLLPYATNYILQMTLAAGFTLYKLLNSFFASYVDLEDGKDVFKKTIHAIRRMSVVHNDLPARLAEVLAQLWRGGGSGGARSVLDKHAGMPEGSLTLKVRCRMSMSLVYDSVWRWREEFQAQGRGNLDSAVKNPTDPDTSTADASTSCSTTLTGTTTTTTNDANLLAHSHAFMATTSANTPTMVTTPGAASATAAVSANGTLLTPGPARSPNSHSRHLTAVATTTTTTTTNNTTPNLIPTNYPTNPAAGGSNNTPLAEPTYEVFDPLNWMLDGLVDFPYSFNGMQSLGAEGLA